MKYSFINLLSIFFFHSSACIYINFNEVLFFLVNVMDKCGYTKWCSRGGTSTLLNCVWLYLKVVQIQQTWTFSDIQRYYLISHCIVLWSSAEAFCKFFENKEPHYQLAITYFFVWEINYKFYFSTGISNHCNLFWSHLGKKISKYCKKLTEILNQ